MGRVPRISQRSLLATAALVAVAVYAVRCADTAAPRPARKPDAPLAIEATATHELADSLRAAEAAVAQAIPILDEARQRLAESPRTAERVARTSPCEWAGGITRTDASLSGLLLFGGLRAENLMRHRLLNPTDRPLCPAEESELRNLVGRYRQALDPVISNWCDVELREQIAQIDAGLVPAWTPPPVTEARMHKVARFVMRQQKIDFEHALRYVRENPETCTPQPTGGYVMSRGNCYLLESFGPLPQSAAAFDGVKFAAFEGAGLIVGWFVHHGFTDGAQPDLVAALQALQDAGPSSIRR